MAIELSEEPFNSDGSEDTQKAWELKRGNPANSKHIYRLSVVAEHERPTGHGTPPQGLSPERDLPIVKSQTDIRIEQLKMIDARSWRWESRHGNAIRSG